MYELHNDGIVEEIFLTHYSGGTLCMVSKLAKEMSLHDVVNRTRATSLTLTPTLSGQMDPETLPFLKVIIFTGEPLTRFVRESTCLFFIAFDEVAM